MYCFCGYIAYVSQQVSLYDCTDASLALSPEDQGQFVDVSVCENRGLARNRMIFLVKTTTNHHNFVYSIIFIYIPNLGAEPISLHTALCQSVLRKQQLRCANGGFKTYQVGGHFARESYSTGSAGYCGCAIQVAQVL